MPPTARLEHFLTYTDASSIDQHLHEYRAAGFLVVEQTARHRGGLRNGFVGFGPDYVEFVWVEDEAEFARGHPKMPEITRPQVRCARRPFGIGLVAADVEAVHDAWVARGYQLPPVFTEVPPAAPPGTPPALSLQPIPPDVLPGALCFALTYHFAAAPERVAVPPNTAYAIGGVTFVTDAPDRHASSWRGLLAPDAPLEGDRAAFALGPHTLRWLTPAQFEREFRRAWRPAPHEYGELAVLHVLAERLDRAETQIRHAGMPITRLETPDTGEPMLLFGPGPRDGLLLAMTQYPAAQWAAERRSTTDEEFELVVGAAQVSQTT